MYQTASQPHASMTSSETTMRSITHCLNHSLWRLCWHWRWTALSKSSGSFSNTECRLSRTNTMRGGSTGKFICDFQASFVTAHMYSGTCFFFFFLPIAYKMSTEDITWCGTGCSWLHVKIKHFKNFLMSHRLWVLDSGINEAFLINSVAKKVLASSCPKRNSNTFFFMKLEVHTQYCGGYHSQYLRSEFTVLFMWFCFMHTSGARVTLGKEAGEEEVVISGLDEAGYLRVRRKNGEMMSVQPDGNSFDMMRGLLVVRKPWRKWVVRWWDESFIRDCFGFLRKHSILLLAPLTAMYHFKLWNFWSRLLLEDGSKFLYSASINFDASILVWAGLIVGKVTRQKRLDVKTQSLRFTIMKSRCPSCVCSLLEGKKLTWNLSTLSSSWCVALLALF